MRDKISHSEIALLRCSVTISSFIYRKIPQSAIAKAKTPLSAALKLGSSKQDVPRLVVVRRLVGLLHFLQHPQRTLHGGSCVDRVEPPLDVWIFLDIDAARIGAAQPRKG